MKKRRDSVVSCSRGLLLFGAAALASAGLGGCDWIQDRFKARAPEVKQCFVQMAFTYAHGRAADPDNADRCALDRLSQKFRFLEQGDGREHTP